MEIAFADVIDMILESVLSGHSIENANYATNILKSLNDFQRLLRSVLA